MNYAQLQRIQGEPFWLQLAPSTLQMLSAAAGLTHLDLAHLLHRSESRISQYLAGQGQLGAETLDKIEDLFSVRLLQGPDRGHPLCQYTPRSLRLARKAVRVKGKMLGRETLAGLTGIPYGTLRDLERTDRPRWPEPDTLARLSAYFRLGFFLLP